MANQAKQPREQRRLSLGEAYITIAVMLLCLVGLYAVAGWDLKITLLVVLVFNVFMGWRCGVPFKAMEKAIGDRIGSLGFFMLVLLGIGFMMACCIMSGTIPVLVSWLADLINPSIVLVLCLILPSILSVAVISSFATLGTLGIVMFSVATMSGIPAGLAAAACICGCNFGQYFSPLGDTTNLCAQVNGISLQRFMKGFSVPFGISYVISIIFFAVMGIRYGGSAMSGDSVAIINGFVQQNFNTSVIILLPFIIAVILALLKVHAIVMIYGTGVTALILGFTLQGFPFLQCVNAAYSGFSTNTFMPGVEVPAEVAGLLNRGGIYSMADGIVFFLIMLACIAVLDAIGVFDVLKESMFKKAGNAGSTTLKASVCSFIFAIVACEPYTTIMLSSEVINKPIVEAGYDPTKAANIGIAMGQCTAYLSPWSFLAIYMGYICGVGVLDFAPYAILFWATPIVIVILSFIGIGNKRLPKNEKAEAEMGETQA